MIPAKHTCPTTWTEEYDGYLTSAYHGHGNNKVFECMDNSPERVPGGGVDQQAALFYHNKVECGVLPCPPYNNRNILTCAVCTK